MSTGEVCHEQAMRVLDLWHQMASTLFSLAAAMARSRIAFQSCRGAAPVFTGLSRVKSSTRGRWRFPKPGLFAPLVEVCYVCCFACSSCLVGPGGQCLGFVGGSVERSAFYTFGSQGKSLFRQAG